MKKVFEDDQSYLEMETRNNKVIVTLCARDDKDSLNVTMVSVEIDKDELKQIVEKL